MRDGPLDRQTHWRYFDSLPALREIELGGEPVRESAQRSLRVAVWNVERLRHVDAVVEILSADLPDAVLLSEVDNGMVRSGNRHGLAELSRRLRHTYAYGVEFVELGLGDPEETAANSDQQNALGFHGNAVTSAIRLRRPFMVRLEADGGWFGPQRGQQRVGGRMAIGAQIELAGRPVTVVSVHLESNSNPAGRKMQVTHLLDVIEKYDADAPVLVAGDFNTSTIDRTRDRDLEFQRAELVANPARLVAVEAYEPLFQEMASRGFDWRAGNIQGRPTERPQPGRPTRPMGKIDWIFTRGLQATAPAVVPALRKDGSPISDHDCLLVTVELLP
jgi:endonuclease/exonuclease/phosphatase family metal-dependent hydrolase